MVITALISCGLPPEKTSSNSSEHGTICGHSRFYGEIEICLPEIDGMTETYSHTKVKQRADLFSYDNNTILGLYLSKVDMAKLDDFDRAELDDYFKVYALKKLEGIEIGKSEFAQLEEYSKGNFLQKDWEEIRDKVLDGSSELSIGQPIQIETYKPNEDIFTTLLLAKMINGSEERISAFTISMVRLKSSLVYYAYYKNYSGPKTLDDVRAKNDLFGFKIIEINKQ
jgi:hypothetical protein